MNSPRERYTFRGNTAATRHGWLRLTPAYSVHAVRELLEARRQTDAPVLDPFCGTGTTLLTCAEAGVACDTLDINPFLVWLARAKSASYSQLQIASARRLAASMQRAAERPSSDAWVPALHRIERWWDPHTLCALASSFERLRASRAAPPAKDLATLAFCRALIRVSAASFGHQSMSFKLTEAPAADKAGARVAHELEEAIGAVTDAARSRVTRARRRTLLGDARDLSSLGARARYGTVITSPPYANRMSYIRELRPYMYWLGHLTERSQAGELDWRAIGGTWGAATSRLNDWVAPRREPAPGLYEITRRIARHSELLSRYVIKYFCDMQLHVRALRPRVLPHGTVHYIVGNSKFYDALLPVETLLAAQLTGAGFVDARVTRLRKRTSKRELHEYLVSARAPKR